MRQQEIPHELQAKMQTAQFASQIFHNLALQKENAEAEPKKLVDRAFALAIAFDNQAQEFMKPSAIQKPPSGLKLT